MTRRRFSRGCKSHPATAPAGSNRAGMEETKCLKPSDSGSRNTVTARVCRPQRESTPSKPHMTRAWSRGRITGTSKGLQLLRYPRSKPICATRPVSEHGQPHMRSPLIAAAPRSRFRRAGLREDENHSRKRHFRPWLATVRLPGSARTDQVLGDDGITLVYSLGNLHRNAFDNDTGGHVFPERDQ